MKRHLLALILVAMLLPFVASAQYFYLPFNGTNPGGLNNDAEYPVGGGLPTGWAVITTGPATAWSAANTVPFAFQFNGSAATSYKVSPAGVVSFATTVGSAITAASVALPNASIPDKSICALGVKIASGDYIISKTFGTSPNRQHWIQFNSATSANNSCWLYWSIVLEETTNNIYIVDQRNSGVCTGGMSLGIQINSTSAVSVTGSPNVAIQSAASETPSDNYYYKFAYGTQLARDVTISTLNGIAYTDTIAAYPISGQYSNLGSTTIGSYELNYSIDNGPVHTDSIIGQNVASSGTGNFQSSQPWLPTAPGTYELKVWISNINGQPDQNNINDTTFRTMHVFSELPNKNVILEEGTGAWCGWCPDGEVTVGQIMATRNDVISVSIHNGDAMAFPAGNAVNSAYLSGYPGGTVNRILFSDQPAVGLSRTIWAAKVEEASKMIYPVETSTVSTFNPITRQVTVSVTANFVGEMTGDIRLNAYIVEDNVTGSGNGYNQVNYLNTQVGHPYYGAGSPIVGYSHRHVLRQMLGGSWGTAGVVPAITASGSSYTQSYTYTLPASYDENEIEIVGLVQMFGASTSDRPIINSDHTTMSVVSGLENMMSGVRELMVYPNPTSDVVNVQFTTEGQRKVSVRLLNLLGETVGSIAEGENINGRYNQSIAVDNLPAGIYLMQIVVDGNQVTRKVVVQ